MGINAITYNDDEEEFIPTTPEEWGDWVSASRTRAYILGDTLTDWLGHHGETKGFVRDDQLDGYDERLIFAPFIMGQGNAFEAAVARHLDANSDMLKIAQEYEDVRSLEAAERTFHALAAGQPIVHQGVLRDPCSRTYGAPDFLVRSDVLDEMFPGCLAPGEASVAAPDLDGEWHYIVVDAKFTTLHLLASGEVGNGGSAPAYKAQLAIYNRALGRLQGYAPPRAFLLGRGWEQTRKGDSTHVRNAMNRLGPVSVDVALLAQADTAADWQRRVRREGAAWDVLPTPSIPELWPPKGGDWPWGDAVKRISKELDDLTQLWQVSGKKRDDAVRQGITSWRDPRVTAASLGVNGPGTAPALQAILDVNQSTDGPIVRPDHIRTAEDEWRPQPPLEFFVDFETVSNLKDDFALFPEENGQPLIFMVGCGHVENGEWVFRCFITDRLDEPSEARMIDEWLAHMGETGARLSNGHAPNVIHWSYAEPINYEEAYDSARNRHPEKGWPLINWFDLWNKVVRREPVVVRGAMNFGLKTFARAMHGHGLINTTWGDSGVDGMGAMVGAWRCDEEAEARAIRLTETNLMHEITEYNEVDCKTMMEILQYLREHH